MGGTLHGGRFTGHEWKLTTVSVYIRKCLGGTPCPKFCHSWMKVGDRFCKSWKYFWWTSKRANFQLDLFKSSKIWCDFFENLYHKSFISFEFGMSLAKWHHEIWHRRDPLYWNRLNYIPTFVGHGAGTVPNNRTVLHLSTRCWLNHWFNVSLCFFLD